MPQPKYSAAYAQRKLLSQQALAPRPKTSSKPLGIPPRSWVELQLRVKLYQKALLETRTIITRTHQTVPPEIVLQDPYLELAWRSTKMMKEFQLLVFGMLKELQQEMEKVRKMAIAETAAKKERQKKLSEIRERLDRMQGKVDWHGAKLVALVQLKVETSGEEIQRVRAFAENVGRG